jgi:ATP/ADP translocase
VTQPAGGGRESASLRRRIRHRFAAFLDRIVDVRPNETSVMWTAFVFFFLILSSYFILRPIRDAVAVQTGVRIRHGSSPAR